MDEPGLGSASVAQAPGFTRWMLDSSDTTALTDILLQGGKVEFDKETGSMVAVLPDGAKEILNEFGRRIVISSLAANCHKGITLSNLSEKRISLIVQELHKAIAHKLLAEWEKIGVSGPDDVPRVVSTYITPTLYAGMRRSAEGLTLKQINKMQTENVTVHKKDGGGMFKLGGRE